MYSNLVHSQEVNEDVDYKHKTETTVNLGRESSLRISSMRSLSSGSSGARSNSSRSNTTSLRLSFSRTGLANENAITPETSKDLPEVSVFRLAHLNKAEAPVLVAAAIAAIVTGAILPVFGLLLSSVIKTFYELPHKLKKDSEFWALMLVVLGVVSFIAYPSRTYLFGIAGNKLIQRIRLMCFEKVVNMEIGWFDEPENSSGVVGARLSTDAALIRALVGDALAQLVQDAAAALVGLAIAFAASWQLSLIIVAMIPLLFLSGYAQITSTVGFSRDAKVHLSNQ